MLTICPLLPSEALRTSARARIAELLDQSAIPSEGSGASSAPEAAQLTSWKKELEGSLAIYEDIVKRFGTAADQKRTEVRAIDTLLRALTETTNNGPADTPPSTPIPQSLANAVHASRITNRSSDHRATDRKLTPVHLYWPAILASLIELGGRAPKEAVLQGVERKLTGVLTSADREVLPSGVDVRWRNRAAWQRFNMIKLGLLRSDSPRGVWEIDDAGRQWLEDFNQKAGWH